MTVGRTYFARRERDGAIKIGQTWWAPEARVRELQWQHGNGPCCLLAEMPSICWERRFHAHFEPLHLGGEWFSPTLEMVALIADIIAGEFDPNTISESGWCITRPFQTKASLAYWGPLPRYEQRDAA